MKKLRPATGYLVQLVLRLIPETRFFGLKVKLLRFAGATLDSSVRVCSSVTILGNGGLSVGAGTWIGHQAMIVCSADVTIGARVDIGPRVYIGTGSHVIDAAGDRAAGQGVSSPIAIGDGAWIGAGAMILPGVTIGGMAVIGAGALVTKDVASGDVVAGVPAKRLRNLWDDQA